MPKQLLCALAGLLLTGHVTAETRYITDTTYVPMRSGPGNEYRILHRGLKTGTPLELLEDDAGNGFSKVKNGEQEGYIPSQYLMPNQPAFRQLPTALEKNRQIEEENRTLAQKLVEWNNQLEAVTAKLVTTQDQLSGQQIEMKRLREISEEPLAMDRRNRQLVEESERLKSQLQVLQAENHQLLRDSSLRWYLFGGGTVVMGILLGLFLPMLRIRKKQSNWV